MATRICESTEWKKPWPLAALAAAHAETGQFDRAIECQNKAISKADEKEADVFRQHLELYSVGKACRDSGP